MNLLIIYETYTNGTDTRKTIKEYETYNEALTVFHNELAKAIPDTNVKSLSVSITNTDLSNVKREIFVRQTTVTESEEV